MHKLHRKRLDAGAPEINVNRKFGDVRQIKSASACRSVVPRKGLPCEPNPSTARSSRGSVSPSVETEPSELGSTFVIPNW